MRVKELRKLLNDCDPDAYIVVRSTTGFYTIDSVIPDMILSGSEKHYTYLITLPVAEYSINYQP